VLGHSLGAATILSAALARPGRFAGMVLVAPASTTGLDFLPDEASFEALFHPTREQQRALARAAFRRPPPEDDLRELMAILELASASTSKAQPARCGHSPVRQISAPSTSRQSWCAATATGTYRSAIT